MFTATSRGKKRRIRPTPVQAKKRRTGPAVSGGRITRRYLQGTNKVRKVLRYYDKFTLNPGATGLAASHQWRANGIHDPDFLLGGHQARGFDEYMTMYDHYTVTKCTAKVYFDNNAEQSGVLGVLHVRDSGTAFVTQPDIMEYGMKTVVPIMAANSGSGGSVMKTATIAVDIAKFLGIKDILDSRECSGMATTDPAEEVIIHVSAFPINAGDAQPINCAIELEYEVWFHEPKNPGES